jgi:hypothetical protein
MKQEMMDEDDILANGDTQLKDVVHINNHQSPPRPAEEKPSKREQMEIDPVQLRKPLTPQKKMIIGVNTEVVKDKLIKILNTNKRGNRPSTFDDEKKKILSTDDLPHKSAAFQFHNNS